MPEPLLSKYPWELGVKHRQLFYAEFNFSRCLRVVRLYKSWASLRENFLDLIALKLERSANFLMDFIRCINFYCLWLCIDKIRRPLKRCCFLPLLVETDRVGLGVGLFQWNYNSCGRVQRCLFWFACARSPIVCFEDKYKCTCLSRILRIFLILTIMEFQFPLYYSLSHVSTLIISAK